MHTRSFPLVAMLAAGVLFAGCAAPPSGDAAATVDGREISRSDLEAAVRELTSDDPGITPERRAEAIEATQATLLNRMIQAAVILNVAQDRGLDVTDEEVARARALVLDAVGGEDALRQILVQQQLTMGVFDTVMVPQEAAIRLVLRDLAGDEREELRTVRHILLEDETEANEVVELLAAGADFAELAQERSMDPGSAAAGGALPPTAPGRFVAGFEEAAWAAPVETVVGPVESQFGWHVLEVVDIEVTQLSDLTDSELGQRFAAELDAMFQPAFASADVVLAPGMGRFDPATGVVPSPRVGSPAPTQAPPAPLG